MIPDSNFPVGAARQEDVGVERIPLYGVDGSLMPRNWPPIKDFTFGADGPQLALVGADQNHRLIWVKRHTAERFCIIFK